MNALYPEDYDPVATTARNITERGTPLQFVLVALGTVLMAYLYEAELCHVVADIFIWRVLVIIRAFFDTWEFLGITTFCERAFVFLGI